MSNTITTIAGDTFELLSRRAYGVETKAPTLRKANPGVSEPFEVGVVVNVPTAPTSSAGLVTADNEDELALVIDGSAFRFWVQISIIRTIDAMDQVAITAPFDPDDQAFRDAFRPFSYNPVEVLVGGVALFNGVMLPPEPSLTESGRTVSVACYSAPGVLGDVTAPASMYPLEWNSATLATVAADLCEPFGLTATFDAGPGATFERVALLPGQPILPFIIKLAQQRGLLVTSTAGGELLFTESTAEGSPVAKLEEGQPPLVTVTPSLSGQQYYSEVTGIEPTIVGLSGGQVTTRNPHTRGVVRPFTFEVPDTIDADVQAAVDNKAGRMFASAASYSLTVSTWRDANGDLWAPNTTIKLTAPGAMVYDEYEFLIRAVVLTRTSKGNTATLTCVLPGAYRGEMPEALPWD